MEHLLAIKHVFTELPVWHFWDANDFAHFKRNSKLPRICLLKIDQPLDLSRLTISAEPVEQPLVKIHCLQSMGILFGYALEIPRLLIETHKKYITIVRQSAKKEAFFEDARLTFQNSHLNVFTSAVGATVVTFNERYEAIDPDYLRVGVKARHTDAKR